jgi:hypothetical protein
MRTKAFIVAASILFGAVGLRSTPAAAEVFPAQTFTRFATVQALKFYVPRNATQGEARAVLGELQQASYFFGSFGTFYFQPNRFGGIQGAYGPGRYQQTGVGVYDYAVGSSLFGRLAFLSDGTPITVVVRRVGSFNTRTYILISVLARRDLLLLPGSNSQDDRVGGDSLGGGRGPAKR